MRISDWSSDVCSSDLEVVLGEGCVLHSHTVIGGRTRVGPRTEIFPFASIGLRPQDLKYRGEPSELVIGSDTVIREHVTMNPGTEGGGMVTRVGDRCLLMVGTHKIGRASRRERGCPYV